MSSRDANSKKAASEASTIFQAYYPEFLVSIILPSCFESKPDITHFLSVQEILCERADPAVVDLLGVQAIYFCADSCEDERRWLWLFVDWKGAIAAHQRF